MRRGEALGLLGLSEPYGPDQLRAAYRLAARRLHPDRPGAPPDATDQMAAVNTAYAVLSGTLSADLEQPPPPTPPPPRPGAAPSQPLGPVPLTVQLLDDGSLLVDAPADETFERLLEAVEVIGDPTYVDAAGGLLQVMVRHEAGGYCYLTFSLQGRAGGTEVFTTLERLDRRGRPDAGALLARLADTLSEA
jgi:curved DNA-binding protein CbpA